MKILIVLATILATTFGEVNVDELWECVEGSETGNKIGAALESCFKATEDELMRSDEWDNTTCYDYNTTVAYLQYIYRNDYCVLLEMGWLNEDGNSYNWTTWMNDIEGLPEDVSTAVLEGKDAWEQCVMDKLYEGGQDPCYNGSVSLYSDEERKMLADIGTMIAQYECFQDGLMESCSEVEDEIFRQCVANSDTGEKIENAFDTCFGETERSLGGYLEVHSRYDNGEQCYDYNTTVAWLYDHYQDDICVLTEMGWFLTNGTTGFEISQIEEDINGLPSDVSQGVWDKQDEWAQCVTKYTEEGGNNPCYNGTESLYNDEERELLATLGEMIVQYECFKHYLFQVCNELFG